MTFEEFRKAFEKIPVEHYPTSVPKDPLVSICIQTYQHEAYIGQCLDGILMQEVDFDYVILLSEDNSSDRTREICQQYADRYPDKIRLFLHHRENNIHVDQKPSGRFALIYNLFHAKSPFIALCDGDDYWTTKDKLRNQVQMLQGNETLSSCFTDAMVRYPEREVRHEDLYPSIKKRSVYNRFDVLSRTWFMPTSSLVFRDAARLQYLDLFYKYGTADYIIHACMATLGDIAYEPRVTVLYRREGQGISASHMKGLKNREYFYKRQIADHFQLRKDFDLTPEEEKAVLEKINYYRSRLVMNRIKQRRPPGFRDLLSTLRYFAKPHRLRRIRSKYRLA